MKTFVSDSFVNKLADSLSRSTVIEIAIKNTIVHALISSRIEKSMNQSQFAKFMGVSQAMVSKWESGDYNFTVEAIARICDKHGLVASLELICEDDYSAMMRKNDTLWDNGSADKETIFLDVFSTAA